MMFRFNPRICTKALYSNPGICRCVRCRPELHLPKSCATGPAPDAAARSILLPKAAGGGNPLRPSAHRELRRWTPLPPIEALPLSGAPIGGLCPGGHD